MELDLKLTFDLLPIIAVGISILAWVVPGFNDWFEKLDSDKKQWYMTLGLLVTAVGASLLSWAGAVHVYPVDQGWQGLVMLPLVDVLIAIITNAGFYKGTNKVFEKLFKRRS